MGLPQIIIEFQEKQSNFVYRLGRGMVAIAFVDASFTAAKVIIASAKSDIEAATASLDESVKTVVANEMTRALEAGAAKVVAVGGKDVATVTNALSARRFNYLAIGNLTDSDQTSVVTWAKEKGFACGRNFIVVGNQGLAASPEAHVVALDKANLTASDMTTAMLAGLLAGLSKESGTYYVLDTDTDGTGYATREQADADVDKGVVTVFFDGEKAKLSRAVTTLYKTEASSALAKIRNVDTMNMIKDDIKDAFENQYVGKVLNSYDNKMALVALINSSYLAGLSGDVLNPDYANSVDINVAKHMELAKQDGKDVSEMTEMQLRKYDTGAAVYLAGSVCFLDTMEDLTIEFVIE